MTAMAPRFSNNMPAFILASIILILSLSQDYASASVYIGGHMIAKPGSIPPGAFPIENTQMFTGFNGTSDNPPRTADLQSIMSTAGWSYEGGAIIQGTVFQADIRLNPNNYVDDDPQVWRNNGGTVYEYGCHVTNTCTRLGLRSTIHHVEADMVWSPDHTTAIFYAKATLDNGMTNSEFATFTPGANGDASDRFSAGESEEFVSSPFGDYFFNKNLQFGIEGDAPTTGWQVEQYNMAFWGTNNLDYHPFNSLNVNSNTGLSPEGTATLNQGSTITWYYDSDHNKRQIPVGTGSTYQVSADYTKIDPQVPIGYVKWSPGTALPANSALWGDGSVDIVAKDGTTGDTLTGLPVSIINPPHRVLASGSTPFYSLITASNNYQIEFNNTDNYHFMSVVPTSFNSCTNVHSWGGKVISYQDNAAERIVVGNYLNIPSGGSISVASENVGYGNCELPGLPVQLQDSNHNVINSGRTPITFSNLLAGTYYVVPSDNSTSYFNQWPDTGGTTRLKQVSVGSDNTLLTPLYGNTPPANTTLAPNEGQVGQPVSVSGSNFDPDSPITITYDGTSVASAATDSQGSFATSFAVPPSIPGPHAVKTSDVGDFSNTQAFTVTGCTPPASGDWIVTSSCTVPINSTAPANVIVEPNAVLTIPDGVTLTVNFGSYHLLVSPSGQVFIQHGGKISS